MGGNPKVSARRRQRGDGVLWDEDVGGVCAEGAKGGGGVWVGFEEEDGVAAAAEGRGRRLRLGGKGGKGYRESSVGETSTSDFPPPPSPPTFFPAPWCVNGETIKLIEGRIQQYVAPEATCLGCLGTRLEMASYMSSLPSHRKSLSDAAMT